MKKKTDLFQPDLGECSVDLAAIHMNKHHESICGDTYTIAEEGDRKVLVLSDGLGSGVKANILATLTATMLSTMIAGNISPEEAVRAVARTLPVCKVRGLAYSAFTVLSMEGFGAELLQFDNPDAILIRDGKIYDYPVKTIRVDEKEIHISRFTIQEGDMLLMMSDGVTNAGVGKTNYSGWGREDVMRCVQKWYYPGITAREMAGAVADAGYALNLEVTVDDLSVIALNFCRPRVVNLMIGPPASRMQDKEYLESFFDRSGKHVVCGGTTAKMAAEYLDEVVIPLPDTMTPEIPARMEVYGVDLVTEGVLTLEAVLELWKECLKTPLTFVHLENRNDGASMLTNMLFGYATQINLFFGAAVNEGYEGMQVARQSKKETVEELVSLLQQAGKTINTVYWAL